MKAELRIDNPSSAGLAQKFVSLLHDVQLPATFGMHALSPKLVLREFELGYTYARASASVAASIEAELFLNIGHQYPVFDLLLSHFQTGPAASAEFDRLSAILLPTSVSSSPNLVRLPSLAELFGRASWQQTLVHLTNADPNVSGAALVSALISTHTETGGASSGGGGDADVGMSPHLLTLAPFRTVLSVSSRWEMPCGLCLLLMLLRRLPRSLASSVSRRSCSLTA